MINKDTLKIAFIGEVDHGKSSLIGRLMLETNSVSETSLKEIKRISKELGQETALAFFVDQLKEERENNCTLDTTEVFLKTRKRNYVLIDTPGHLEFLKNMMTGTSHADAAVLVIDVCDGMREQTKRHGYLIKMLGIKTVVVAVNKMDLVNYTQEKFIGIKNELYQFFESLKMAPSYFIPISAKNAENISQKSSKMSWYKGPALLEAMDSIEPKLKPLNKPLRFPIQDVYKIGEDTIAVGRIVSGSLMQNEKIIIFPSRKETKIHSIRAFNRRKTKAQSEESIGLTLTPPLFIKRGDVICQKKNQPAPTLHFDANIFWLSDKPLKIAKAITIRCATQEVGCVVEKINQRIDSATLETIEKNATELKLNDIGIISLISKIPLVVEKFDFIEELGRFVIEDNDQLLGVGIIQENNRAT